MPTLPPEQMQFNAAQANLVHELFVCTADENYMTARWCAAEGLNTDFLWLATHALEKYMKAILLLNGEATLNDGHDIVALYERVRAIAADLLPTKLDQPKSLDIHHWSPLTPETFLQRLYNNGNADNRYLIYGYATQSQDLHMLDAMVFALRRLVCRLDGLYIYSDQPGAPDFTSRELLLRQPNHFPRLFMPLDNAISAKITGAAQHAALNLNMPFAPKDYPHTPMRGGSSSRTPVLLRRILEPLASDDLTYVRHGVDLANWLFANVKLPGSKKHPGVRQEIEAAIATAKQKHGLA